MEIKNNTLSRGFLGESLILILISSIGTLLRFYNLGVKPLWYDEASTYLFSKASLMEVFKNKGLLLPNHIGQWLFLHPLLLFSKTEWVLRFPSALFGVLSIPLSYFLFKKIFERDIALLTTIIIAFHPTLIWHSQDARVYSLWLFFSLLSVFLLINSSSNYLWVLISSFLMYLHLYSLFLVIFQFFYLKLVKQKLTRPLILFFVLSLPSFILAIIQILTRRELFSGVAEKNSFISGLMLELKMIGGEIPEYFGSTDITDLFTVYVPQIFALILIFIILLNFFKKDYIYSKNEIIKRHYLNFVILYIIFPPLASFFFKVPFYSRYNIYIVLFAMPILVDSLIKRTGKILSVILIPLFLVYLNIVNYKNLTTEVSISRPIPRKILNEIANSNEKVLLNSPFLGIILNYYKVLPEKLIIVIPEDLIDKQVIQINSTILNGSFNFKAPSECNKMKEFIKEENLLIIYQNIPVWISRANWNEVLLKLLKSGLLIYKNNFVSIIAVSQE